VKRIGEEIRRFVDQVLARDPHLTLRSILPHLEQQQKTINTLVDATAAEIRDPRRH
jgi:hypothetical protein